MNHAKTLILAASLASFAGASGAADLSLPNGAELRFGERDAAGRYAMPVAGWAVDDGIAAEVVSGSVTRQAWRIGGTGLSSFQIILNLRQQLVDQGYDIRFECDAPSCGGFDFRYGTEVVGEPDMHVDLRDFHFLSASRGGAEPDHVSLLVSRSPSAGFVQVISVGALEAQPVAPMTSTKAEPDAALPAVLDQEVGPAMETVGRFVLTDLVFNTGSSELGPGRYTSLTDLADYLQTNPGARVALVGHTDAQGSLAGNISLSKRRAESVMARLIADFGIAAERLEAEGIGYLAPIASNQTNEGRTLNRRVEAILTSTE